jgi:protein SERAC1
VQTILTMTHSIVAVHGLNGDAFQTWTTEKSRTFWLGDESLLPRALRTARILTFGYNANVASLLGSTSSDRILQHSQNLVAQLEADRAVSY